MTSIRACIQHALIFSTHTHTYSCLAPQPIRQGKISTRAGKNKIRRGISKKITGTLDKRYTDMEPLYRKVHKSQRQ